MIAAYAVKCRYSDVGILRNALSDSATVRVVDPEGIEMVSPSPDLIFVGWGGQSTDWADNEEERRIRNLSTTCILLRKIRRAVAFRDVPIVIVAEPKDAEDTMFSAQFGASRFLVAPLEERAIRSCVAEVMRPIGEQTAIDVSKVNPFINATLFVLEQMAHVKAKKREVLLKKDYRLFGEVSAVIGITGQDIEGSVALTFQNRLANEIVAAMWDRPVKEITREEVNDGLGELVNVISGQATTELSKEHGSHFSFALPTIVSGFGHEIQSPGGIPCLSIVFEAWGKPFAVQVAIRE